VLPTNVEATIAGVAVEGDAVASAADGSYGRGTDWYSAAHFDQILCETERGAKWLA